MTYSLRLGSLLSMICACAAPEADVDRPAERSLAILDGTPALEHTGVVFVEHALGQERCTGALVTPRIVLTAAHCAFAADGVSTRPLAADGFRVGFGDAVDALSIEAVETVVLPRAQDPLTLPERVALGIDIVGLVLASDANAVVHEAAAPFQPNVATELELVGFGVSSRETGAAGEKLSGLSSVVGWDRERGILELEGAGACLGDSGGPALDDAGRWVGLVSSVSATEEGLPCAGRTLVHTVLNADVSGWLNELVDGIDEPPVSPGEPETDAGAEPMTPAPSEPEAEPSESAEGGSYASCSTRGPAQTSGWVWVGLVFAAHLLARRQRRGA